MEKKEKEENKGENKRKSERFLMKIRTKEEKERNGVSTYIDN